MNMADNVLPRGRNFDHRFFAAAAAVMLFAVLVGFGPTFYLKPFFNNPPVARSIIYVHGFVMAAWVALFVVQVYFVSSKRIKLHQKLGMAGVALAVAVFTVGLMVTVAAARYGPASAPANIPPLQFMIVPFGDMLVFVVLFGAAIYYRKNSPNHKRLMLLTMINFLAPAIARFPGGLTNDYGPLWFFGVPTVLTIALIAIDTWRHFHGGRDVDTAAAVVDAAVAEFCAVVGILKRFAPSLQLTFRWRSIPKSEPQQRPPRSLRSRFSHYGCRGESGGARPGIMCPGRGKCGRPTIRSTSSTRIHSRTYCMAYWNSG
jgi:hypothetical protein